MNFHLVDLMSYHLWTLICAIFFPIIAAIATFVCLRRAQTAKKLVGFFIIIPIYVAVTVLICGDTGSIMSDLFPQLGIYPVIGFLAAICLGIICLNFIAVVCGAGILKRKGALINTVAALLCFGINAFIIFFSWVFANYKYKTELYLKDDGLIDIREALILLVEPLEFIPDAVFNSGIELLALAILAIFLIIYFLSFISLKTPEEIMKEDLERRRRAALESGNAKNARAKKHHDEAPEEEERNDCCATCEHATVLKGDRTKMLCDKCGVVSASHVCRKYLYDPLKRTAFRPQINPLTPDDSFDGSDHI